MNLKETEIALEALGDLYEYVNDYADQHDGRTNEELHLIHMILAVAALIERDAIKKYKVVSIH